MAAPILDERCLILIDKTYIDLWKTAAGYYPGPVTDGAPLKLSAGIEPGSLQLPSSLAAYTFKLG